MANLDELSQYLSTFATQGASGVYEHGLEALYADELSTYDGPPLQAPESYLSGLEATPVIGLDTGSDLTIKAVQIFLSVSGYKGADGKALGEDGTWGKNSQFALDAWKRANAGKSGVSMIAVGQRKGMVWMPSNIAGDMRSKIALVARGAAELKRQPAAVRPAPKPTDSRNAIPTAQGEASAGPGNAFETAQNVRGILRALQVNVSNTGLVDTPLVQAWQKAATSFKLNPAVSGQAGAAMLAVNATTLSTLRAKSRIAGTPRSAPVTKSGKNGSAATTATGQSASSSGTLPVQTAEVQRVLRALGWSKSVSADGKYGPKTKAAWESSAVSRKLDRTISGQAGAGLVNVNSTTFARLQQDASLDNSNGSSTNIVPVAKPSEQSSPKAGLSKVSVDAVQGILIALKANPGKRDGLWGPTTQKAWMAAASARKLDASISRAGPKEAWVSLATYAALESASSAAPAGKTVKKTGKDAESAPQAGLSKVQVGTLQDLLIRLKAKPGKRDGLWGANTKKAWETVAKNRSLDPVISRASPTEAWVSPITLEKLSVSTTGTAVKPNEQKAPPSASDKTLVPVTTTAVSTVMRGFGKTAKTGAELVAAWKSIAKSEKLDERAVLEKGALNAVKNTAETLTQEAGIRISVNDLIKASAVSVPTATLHDAISFWSNYDQNKTKWGIYKPSSRGVWDKDTLVWTLRYLNIPMGTNATVWERATPKLVAKDKKSLKFAAKFVKQMETDAKDFKRLGKAITQKQTVEKKNNAEEKKLQSALDARIKASTVVVSIRSLQQALSELNAKIKEGRIKLPAGAPTPPNVSVSGAWDASTRTGLLVAYGDDLLAKLPVGLADDLLKKLLFKAPGGVAGFAGLVGAGSTHIRVPPAVAKYVADDATQWLLRTKPKTAGAAAPVVFNPTKGGTTQLDPAFITGRVDKPQPMQPIIANAPVQQQQQEEPEMPQQMMPAYQQPQQQIEQPAPTGPTQPVFTPTPREEPSYQGGEQPVIAPAPEPAPEIPAAPAPVAPESDKTWMWFAGGVAALGIGAMLSKGNSQSPSTYSSASVRSGKKSRSGTMRASSR